MRFIRLGICIVLLSLIVACEPPDQKPEDLTPSPIEVTDHRGKVIKLEKIPATIVSLSPANTEIVFALGLEGSLVGVTEYCDYPEAAEDKPKIGGYSTVDIEKVVEIQPDLILASNIHEEEVIPELERLGLTVIDLSPDTIDEVLESIIMVGKITGKRDEALQLVDEMRSRIKAVADRTASLTDTQRPRVFYVVWHDPITTVSSITRIHELIVNAGGINIARDLTDDYPTISLEAVIQANPQVIVATSGHGSGANSPFEFASTEPRLKDIDARINSRVYQIDANLFSRPGPRIVDALEEMARMTHPEIFGD